MNGSTLYPLNLLKTKLPTVYSEQIAKYEGREHILRQTIPTLGDCAWNDVLFMMSADPRELYRQRRSAGFADISPQYYYQIDPSTLDQDKLAVYLFTPGAVFANDFAHYRYDDLPDYAQVSRATIDYYCDLRKQGAERIPLFFRYVPHILYKCSIDVSNCEVVLANP